MRRHLTFILAALCVTACASTSELEAAPEATMSAKDALRGVYAGTYTCSLGENGITMSIDRLTDTAAESAAVEGRLWFYDTAGNPGHPTGAFQIAGTVTGDQIDVSPGEWLSDVPSNWGAAGVLGKFVLADGETYLEGRPSGPGTSACSGFTLKRLGGL